MKRRTTGGRAGGLWLAIALLAGCDTRVVELKRPDGGAASRCSEFVREDGVTCRLCFGSDGAVMMADCPRGTPPVTPPVTPPPPMPPAPAARSCKVVVTGNDRCLTCSGANSASSSACLKCEGSMPSAFGGSCRICVWSDDPQQRCLQCFAPDGSKSEDGCDGLRKESLVYSMGDAGM